MHGLTGDFATMPLRDLVLYLANQQVTGTLTLENEPTLRQVILQAGHITNASSSIPKEYLGQFLINLGHIDDEQFQQAYERQKETKVFLGRILLTLGLIDEENLRSVLAMKFRETVLEAFGWTTGTFCFEPEKHSLSYGEGVQVRVPLIAVYKESDFRVQAWQHFQKVFPTSNCTFTLNRANLEEPPRSGSVDESVLHFIEEGMTLEEIGLRIHATDYFLYNRLYALYQLGALSVHEDVAANIGNDGLDSDALPARLELLENARTFLQQGKYRSAWSLARRTIQLGPNSEATRLMEQIETRWLPQLKATLAPSTQIPKLTLTTDDYKRLPLSAPEKYLMSCINGSRTLRSIIQVAPLKEFEALAFLECFLAEKWIELS